MPATVPADDSPTIGGVHEIAIGTTDLIPLIECFQQFGYRVGRSGDLAAEEAKALYGVDSRPPDLPLFGNVRLSLA